MVASCVVMHWDIAYIPVLFYRNVRRCFGLYGIFQDIKAQSVDECKFMCICTKLKKWRKM